ncbi:MAG: alanyl-tRNA editing protein [Rhodospirillales bacterium]
MTEEIFRTDSYARSCDATVIAIEDDAVVLDRTVFYPEGGGQPGDHGVLKQSDGDAIEIIDTRKGDNGIRHMVTPDAAMPPVGAKVVAEIDWNRRFAHMRMHTLLHLVCAVVDGEISGAAVGAEKSRVDFNLPNTTLDKQALTEELNRRIIEDAPVAARWITDEELEAQPELIKTMTVRPPMGQGHIRLMEIGGIDLQPCGGTHVGSLREIGEVRVSKIENKGRHNRRVNVVFAEES